MKFFIVSCLVFLLIGCKKDTASQIGIDITNPREGLIINFGGGTNRLYFVKIAISSTKDLKQIEYTIKNKANNLTISSYLEDDLQGVSNTAFEISEYMPTGNLQLNVELTCKVTDVANFVTTKTINYSLAP